MAFMRLCVQSALRTGELAASVLRMRNGPPNFCALTACAALQGSSDALSILPDSWQRQQVLLHPTQFQQASCFSATAGGGQPLSREEQDAQYRTVVAAKVRTALEDAMMHDVTLRETLVSTYGFTVHEVRMSPDNMKAFVLWRAFPGYEAAVKVELSKRLKRLRASAARRMQLRHMPRLEMRYDQLTDQQAHLEELMDTLRDERTADAAAEDAEAWRQEEGDTIELGTGTEQQLDTIELGTGTELHAASAAGELKAEGGFFSDESEEENEGDKDTPSRPLHKT